MDLIGSAKLAALTGTIMGGAVFADGVHVDEHTSISLQWAVSVAVTVFICGMWISRKFTRLEDQIEEATKARAAGLASLEKRIDNLELAFRSCAVNHAAGVSPGLADS